MSYTGSTEAGSLTIRVLRTDYTPLDLDKSLDLLLNVLLFLDGLGVVIPTQSATQHVWLLYSETTVRAKIGYLLFIM